MAPTPPSTGRVDQVDFLVHREAGQLQLFEPLRENLQSILKLLKCYQIVLGSNGSIAKHLKMPLFCSRVEARINASFSSPHPRIVELLENGRGETCVSWMDLVREPLSENQFQYEGTDIHRYCMNGIWVEMGTTDRYMLCSGVLQKLLHSGPDPEDMQKERESRHQVVADLLQLNEDALEGKVAV